MPIISVVVPVYNAERYLHRCINSLLSQTFQDFEILLIDDGSQDGSGLICDEYALKDARIKVFHKNNGGVASARELGITNASGNYIIHTDSDDWVERNYLEDLFNCSKESESDITICDYFIDINNSTKKICQHPSDVTPNIVIKDLLTGKLHGALWNKLIKKECYKGVNFIHSMTYEEDLAVLIMILQNDYYKIAYLPNGLYHYDCNANPASLTKKYDLKSYQCDLMILQIYNQKKSSVSDKAYNSKYTQIAYLAFTNNLFSAKEYKNKYARGVKMLLNSVTPIRMKFFTILSAMGFKSLAYAIYSICNKIHILIIKTIENNF